VNVKNLALNAGLLAIALLAAILLFHDLSLALAVWADGLESLNHRTHLAHHCLHTTTITALALLDRAFLSTNTVAFRADDGFL
jgi:hypothetical protein